MIKYSGGIFDSYQEYLASWLWEEKRDEFLRIRPNCEMCGKKATLAHHKTYENVENERLKDLMALCHNCHKKTHKKEEKEDVDIKTITGEGL